jgi:site-specific DNA-methyltransferase (adenine-specific)
MIYTEKYVSKMIKEFENGKLYKGDCLVVMDELADKSVDMILCDLPYGTTQNKWDAVIPFESLWKQYERIIKDNGVIILTASQPFTSALVMSNPKIFKHEWIWEKDGGSNFANTVREPMKEHESVLVFSKGKWTYNKQLEERIGSRKGKITKATFKTTSENYGHFKQAVESEIPVLRTPRSIQRFTRERGLHPTQKPTQLFEYLIRTYSNEGDTILDNCSGSGTTGIAAINTNRQFILIEQDANYFDVSSERIEKHLSN